MSLNILEDPGMILTLEKVKQLCPELVPLVKTTIQLAAQVGRRYGTQEAIELIEKNMRERHAEIHP